MAKSIWLTALIFALLVGACAWGAEPSVIEKVLSAWKDGKPPKGAAGPTPEAKGLESYEIISAATTTQDGVDTVIGTVSCLFSEGAGTLSRWKGVFRVTMDPAAPEGRKVSVEWQPMAGKVAAPPSPKEAPVKMPVLQAEEAQAIRALLDQVKSPDIDATMLRSSMGLLSQYGARILPVLEKELKTSNLRDRWHYFVLVDITNPPEKRDIFLAELRPAILAHRELMTRIRAMESSIKDLRAKHHASASERKRVAESISDTEKEIGRLSSSVGNCADTVNLICAYLKDHGRSDDIPTLTDQIVEGLTSLHLSAERRAEGDGYRVGGAPAVCYPWTASATPESPAVTTVRHSSYSTGWYPWGGEWSALRGLVEKCYDPDVLSKCRNVLSKAMGPWETGRADKWYEAALLKDYRRTLDALIAQVPLAKPAPSGPAVEFAGPDAATLMTAICGLQENETPNDPDKRPRAVKEAEAKAKVRGGIWHVLLTQAVNEAQPPATAWYAVGTYSVEAGTLEMRLGLPSSASGVRVHLGTAQVPLKPDVADAVRKGLRRVELEVWCRINPDDIKPIASARGKTLQPGVTFTGLLVRDAGTQEILYRWSASQQP